jgi:hypothetical protein
MSSPKQLGTAFADHVRTDLSPKVVLRITRYPLVMTNRAIENCHLEWIYHDLPIKDGDFP